MSVIHIEGPHPATLTAEQLLEQCDLRTQRRSGPGGQHRNKTSSGVFLHHKPTNTIGEATERRSQADNRAVALQRLRFRLAVEIRTQSILDQPSDSPSEEVELRERYRGTALKVNDRNEAKSGLIALLLNDLYAAGGQPSAVAPAWQTSTSAVVRLVKSHPAAFSVLNAIRSHHNRGALK
ncbi:MAG: peptide chain release factor-like protein [Rubripirellula sp.]